ncbi:ribosomal protein L7/L12 [Dactylosporangium sp. CA-139066]|uniref:ribosomal protein L7/L12 n=1 Tax=Dactylosporangium sp. CA-139066 TaxID=3239930 RepID=UPI003D90C262
MTTAKREIREIEVKTVETKPVIVLELSEEEARTLHVIYAFVGGSPEASPRGHMQAIGEALGAVFGGVLKYSDHPEYRLLKRDVSGIRFLDYPEGTREPRVFRLGEGSIPLDVETVNDGESYAPHWRRNGDGNWSNTEVNVTLTERELLRDYSTVTEVIDTDLTAAVVRELRTAGKIQAIKLYRERTGLGLREAKEAVEEIGRTNGLHV